MREPIKNAMVHFKYKGISRNSSVHFKYEGTSQKSCCTYQLEGSHGLKTKVIPAPQKSHKEGSLTLGTNSGLAQSLRTNGGLAWPFRTNISLPN